jgi:hypothetical protein
MSCCCAGEGPGLRRAPARLGGRGPGGWPPGGRWPSPGTGGPGAGPAGDLGGDEVLGSGDGWGQGEVRASDERGQREGLRSDADVASDDGFEPEDEFGPDAGVPSGGAPDPAEARGFGADG